MRTRGPGSRWGRTTRRRRSSRPLVPASSITRVHRSEGDAHLLQHRRLPSRRLLDDEPARAGDGHLLVSASLASLTERSYRTSSTSRCDRASRRSRRAFAAHLTFTSSAIARVRPLEHRSHHAAPLSRELPRAESPSPGPGRGTRRPARRSTWWWSFGRVDRADRRVDGDEPLVEEVARDPGGRDVLARLASAHATARRCPWR